LIDIILINYKSTDCLIDCIKSIGVHGQGYPIHIQVQDNNSGEDIGNLKNRFSNITIVENQRNLGFAAAANKAMEKSNAEYMLLLNPDTKITEYFLRSIMGYMETHPDVGILGPRILNDDGTIQGSARSFPTPLTSLFGRNSTITRMFPNNSITARNILTIKNNGAKTIEADWVSGACMFVRRKAYLQVGGLDERFFMYWEDADWCRRMRQIGWKVIYYPKLSISHACGQSSKTRPLRSIFHFHKSCYRLYEKYTSSYQAILLPIVLLGLSIRMSLLLLNTIIKQKLSRNF
jgi:GT2 family glycosyltransferase